MSVLPALLFVCCLVTLLKQFFFIEVTYQCILIEVPLTTFLYSSYFISLFDHSYLIGKHLCLNVTQRCFISVYLSKFLHILLTSILQR
jgi:hypothetical protein